LHGRARYCDERGENKRRAMSKRKALGEWQTNTGKKGPQRMPGVGKGGMDVIKKLAKRNSSENPGAS